MDQNKKIDISSYPEGLEYLAKTLDLPVPNENMALRKNFVLQLVDTLIRQ